jgi:biotin operon repressor
MGDGVSYIQPRVIAITNDLYLKTMKNLETKHEDLLNVYRVQYDYGCGYNLAKTAIENTIVKLREKWAGVFVENCRGKGYLLSIKTAKPSSPPAARTQKDDTKKLDHICECGAAFDTKASLEWHRETCGGAKNVR